MLSVPPGYIFLVFCFFFQGVRPTGAVLFTGKCYSCSSPRGLFTIIPPHPEIQHEDTTSIITNDLLFHFFLSIAILYFNILKNIFVRQPMGADYKTSTNSDTPPFKGVISHDCGATLFPRPSSLLPIKGLA